MRSAVTGWMVSLITSFKTSARAETGSHKTSNEAKQHSLGRIAYAPRRSYSEYCLSTRTQTHEFPQGGDYDRRRVATEAGTMTQGLSTGWIRWRRRPSRDKVDEPC